MTKTETEKVEESRSREALKDKNKDRDNELPERVRPADLDLDSWEEVGKTRKSDMSKKESRDTEEIIKELHEELNSTTDEKNPDKIILRKVNHPEDFEENIPSIYSDGIYHYQLMKDLELKRVDNNTPEGVL